MPRQKKAANQRTAPTRTRRQQTTETEDGMPEFRARSTEALRLLLGQYQLQQTGSREELIARLEAHRNSRQTGTGNTNPENRTNMDRLELAQLIASIVDDRIQQQQKQAEQPNTRARQDGGQDVATRSNPRALEPNPRSVEIQDGGLEGNSQHGQQALQGLQELQGQLPPGRQEVHSVPLPSTSFNLTDPAHIATLHPNFKQPSLASHLSKTTTTAITNCEYVDFASLLPLYSLLTDAINSQLNLKIGEQGLTIPLPSYSKRPKISSIEKWLDAFAILFSLLASAYPSRAVELMA